MINKKVFLKVKGGDCLAYIDVAQKGTSYISCYLDGLDSNWNGDLRTIHWYVNDDPMGSSSLPNRVKSGGFIKFSGLKPNTTYSIDATVVAYASGGGFYIIARMPTIYATTTQGWAWSFPTTSGASFALTSTEWLSFQTVINNARVSNGYPRYSFTTSSEYISKGKGFTSWEFLQAVNAIDQVSQNIAPQLKTIQKGDKIYGWYFDNLASALNSIL